MEMLSVINIDLLSNPPSNLILWEMYLVLSGEFTTFVVTRTGSLTSFSWAYQLQIMNMFPYKSNHTRGFSNRFKDFLKIIIMMRMVINNNVIESSVKFLMKSFTCGKINSTQPKRITLKDTRLLIMHSN